MIISRESFIVALSLRVTGVELGATLHVKNSPVSSFFTTIFVSFSEAGTVIFII